MTESNIEHFNTKNNNVNGSKAHSLKYLANACVIPDNIDPEYFEDIGYNIAAFPNTPSTAPEMDIAA